MKLLRGNIHSKVPNAIPAELTEPLLDRAGIRVERILSRGQASPPDFWYEQEQHEYVILLSGRAILEFETAELRRERVELGPGDWVQIDAGVRHRVDWTDPDVTSTWLAVFYPAR